jgi:hypothetical protein
MILSSSQLDSMKSVYEQLEETGSLGISCSRKANLNIMLCELLRQRSSAGRKGVDGVVDSNLAVFVIQKMIDVLSAFLEDLLSKEDRRCRR